MIHAEIRIVWRHVTQGRGHQLCITLKVGLVSLKVTGGQVMELMVLRPVSNRLVVCGSVLVRLLVLSFLVISLGVFQLQALKSTDQTRVSLWSEELKRSLLTWVVHSSTLLDWCGSSMHRSNEHH